MKICFLGRGTSPHVQDWLRFWAALGHEIHLLTFEPAPIPGVCVHPLKPHALFGRIRYLTAISQVRRLVASLDPDVVVGYYVTGYGLLAALVGSVPVLLCTAGSDVRLCDRSVWRRELVRHNLERSRLVQAPSPEIAERVRLLGIRSERIIVLPRGIDSQGVAQFVGIREPSLIVSTRNHFPVYDVGCLVQAFGSVLAGRPDAKLILLGDGPLRAELERLVAREDLSESVEFAGHRAKEFVFETLARASVYVSTATADGASVSLFEAMASGCFPVVTDIPANRFYIQHTVNGRLFSPGRADLLAKEIVSALEDPEAISAAGLLNADIVETRADRNVNLRVLLQHCEQIAQSSPSP